MSGDGRLRRALCRVCLWRQRQKGEEEGTKGQKGSQQRSIARQRRRLGSGPTAAATWATHPTQTCVALLWSWIRCVGRVGGEERRKASVKKGDKSQMKSPLKISKSADCVRTRCSCKVHKMDPAAGRAVLGRLSRSQGARAMREQRCTCCRPVCMRWIKREKSGGMALEHVAVLMGRGSTAAVLSPSLPWRLLSAHSLRATAAQRRTAWNEEKRRSRPIPGRHGARRRWLCAAGAGRRRSLRRCPAADPRLPVRVERGRGEREGAEREGGRGRE